MARAVAALDLELALFPGGPAGRTVDALQELVEGRALLRLDPLTAEMLEAFGWGPLGEPLDDTTLRLGSFCAPWVASEPP